MRRRFARPPGDDQRGALALARQLFERKERPEECSEYQKLLYAAFRW